MVKSCAAFDKSLKFLETSQKDYIKSYQKSNSDGLEIIMDFVKMRLSAEQSYIATLKKFENAGLKFLADAENKKTKGIQDTLLKRFFAIILSTINCRVVCVQQYVDTMQHSYIKIIENLEILNAATFDSVLSLVDKSFSQCSDILGGLDSKFDEYCSAFDKEKAFFQKNKKYANPNNALNPKAAKKLEDLNSLAALSDRLRCEYNISYVSHMKLANDIRDEEVPQIMSSISNCFDPYFFAFMDLFFRNEQKFSTNLSKKMTEIYRNIDIRNDQDIIVDKWAQLCAPFEKQFMRGTELAPSDSVINLKKSGLSDVETKQAYEIYSEALSSKQSEAESYLSRSREKFLDWKNFCKDLSKVEPGENIADLKSSLSKYTLFQNTELWVNIRKEILINDAKVTVLSSILNQGNEVAGRKNQTQFGIHLTRHCQEMNVDVPHVAQSMMNYIAKHGKNAIDIFKQQSTGMDISKLRGRLDEGKPVLSNTDVYVVANVFKIYIQEMKEFLPRTSLDHLLSVTANKSGNDRLELCAKFINELNSYSSRLFIKLLTFLKVFADNYKVNRMNASELSSVLSKHLFHLEAFEDNGVLSKPYEKILCYMIENADRLARRKISSKRAPARGGSLQVPDGYEGGSKAIKSTASMKRTSNQYHSYNYIADDGEKYPKGAQNGDEYYEDGDGEYYYEDGDEQSNYQDDPNAKQGGPAGEYYYSSEEN